MAPYSNEECLEMVLIYGECQRNAQLAEREYQRRFPDARHPDWRTIVDVVQRLRDHGRFHRPRPGRTRTATDPEHEVDVLAAFEADPHASTRAVAEESGLSTTSVWRIVNRQKFHPYRVHLIQDLHGDDNMRRQEFCLFFQIQMERQPDFLDHLFMCDESIFYRDGTVNRHNCHYWSAENPHWTRVTQFQVRWKVNVWCGIYRDSVVGPVFLEENLNQAGYIHLLNTTLTE